MHRLSAIELRNSFLKGKFSAQEICRFYLNRAMKMDEQLGAFLSLFPEQAMERAKALDEKKASGQVMGKLAGLPIAIKDNIHIEGEITTCGSKFLSNYRAPFSSTVCRLIEKEDAIFIGKTNLDEFAMGSSTQDSAFQSTSNPWDLTCVPGGSSGGSAVAVAARMAPLALGSDTGGSVRQPASFCGIVGFKPTYGRVSRYGLVAYGSSLDQISPFATTVSDTALLMEVIGQHCEHDSTSLPIPGEDYLEGMNKNGLMGMRIGVPREFLEQLAEEPKKIFNDSLKKFQELGAQIVDIDLNILKYALAAYYIIATAEASTNLARFDGIRYGVRAPGAKTLEEIYTMSKEEGFGPEVKRRILLGTFVLSSGYQDAYYRKAQKVRTLIIEKYREAFKLCDLIATPVSPFAAFEKGSIKDPLQMYLEDIYTIPINLAGVPAISVPNGFTSDKKPVGIQLIGPQKADKRVLHAAYAWEQATPFHNAMPPLAQQEI